MVVFGKFWIDLNPKITRYQSVTRFGCEFSPKIANFVILDQFLVIFNLKHLAMLQKWPKSQNYQISQCRQIWMWIFPKIANFGVFDRFLAKNALELSGDAVQIHEKGVIFGFRVWGLVGMRAFELLGWTVWGLVGLWDYVLEGLWV